MKLPNVGSRKEAMIRGLLFGIFIMVGMGATALLAAVPHLFSTGDILDAAKMNENFAAIDPQYNTVEVATHKRWIDGKVIYRKVVNLGALPAAGSINIAHGISNLDTVVQVTCVGTAAVQIILPSSVASIAVSGTTIDLGVNNNLAGYTGRVIIEYTRN